MSPMISPEEIAELLKEALSIDRSSIDFNLKNKKANLSKEDVSSFDSEKLCSLVACNRYIAMDKNMEVLAMQELAKRRQAGDNFNFESKIEEYSKRFIPIDTNIPQVIGMATKMMKNKL